MTLLSQGDDPVHLFITRVLLDFGHAHNEICHYTRKRQTCRSMPPAFIQIFVQDYAPAFLPMCVQIYSFKRFMIYVSRSIPLYLGSVSRNSASKSYWHDNPRFIVFLSVWTGGWRKRQRCMPESSDMEDGVRNHAVNKMSSNSTMAVLCR